MPFEYSLYPKDAQSPQSQPPQARAFSRGRSRPQERHIVTAMANGRPGSSLSNREQPPLPPAPRIQIDDVGAVGEPLIEDFQDRVSPKRVEPPSSPMRTVGDLASQQSDGFLLSSDDEAAPPPPDFTRRGIHIPTRTSSSLNKFKRSRNREYMSGSSAPTTTESRQHVSSSADSVISFETQASSIRTLPPLQAKANLDEADRLEPLLEDDPRSFDLVVPAEEHGPGFSLEKRSEELFCREHLETIFADPPLLLRFTSFLSTFRPHSVPLLIYYLDALKALRAINYANAIAEALEPIPGFDFTEHPARATVNSVLEDKARQAFDALVRDDLPAYITHVFVQVVSVSVERRITGTLAPHLREASEGLAEVFCLSDPSRADNPIVFASEEFHRTTQYGVSYAIGRNCRFLQGPKTNHNSVRRLREAVEAGKELSEVFLNYRRDGSPFMNLLMIAPLLDSRGNLRYFIGAQVDVSGLTKDCTDLEGLQRMLMKRATGQEAEEEKKDEFQELSEMLNLAELDIVRRYGGRMHREQVEDVDDSVMGVHRPRLLLKDPSNDMYKPSSISGSKSHGKLDGIYSHYLLVRPYPSLRILFTSPSLRVPGILQSPFLSRIGGSTRVRDELSAALAEGRGVTAKIRWLSNRADEEGRARWIHCTPLLGQNGTVGVWMVVLVDDEGSVAGGGRRFRMAPPVSSDIGGFHNRESRERERERERRGSDQAARSGLRGNPKRLSLDTTRPGTAMSEQRAVPRGSSPAQTGNGSIDSYAL